MIKRRTPGARKRRTFAAAYAEMIADKSILFKIRMPDTACVRYFRVYAGMLQYGIPYEHYILWEDSTFSVNYLAALPWTTRHKSEV